MSDITSDFDDEPFELDGEPEDKATFLTVGFDFGVPTGLHDDAIESSTGGAVALPGDATAQASGSRAAVPGEHSWTFAGPRNISGRAVALAVDTRVPNVMYAGAASGGVFKTVDSGTTWFPLWQDEAALPVGAIDVFPSTAGTPEVVWVGTGETDAGGAEIIRGGGVFRSTDGGQTWTGSGVPGRAPNLGYSFEAVAVDPTDSATCFAVGKAGVFRTIDGGSTWVLLASSAGVYYSDVKFSVARTAPFGPIVYLVRAVSAAGEGTVVRIDNPKAAVNAANGTGPLDIALALPANQMPVFPAPGVPVSQGQWPARGKIAVGLGPNGPGARDTVYVTFAQRTDFGRGYAATVPRRSHHGVHRSTNARATPPSATIWAPMVNQPAMAAEGQGYYNLSIAVDPNNVNNVATGMINTHVTTNGAAAPGPVVWKRASNWLNQQHSHHSDHHASLFVQRLTGPGQPADLWQAHDGGLSRSTNWLGGNSWAPNSELLLNQASFIQWESRDCGFHATQFYDIAQSPILPSLVGGGLQDNGVLITSGGQTYMFVLGADGGFVAFDPDDPYRLLGTWQGGLAWIEYPGDADGQLPRPQRSPQASFWPRTLTQGFGSGDGPLFVADMAYDPFDSGRVLLARVNRLYGLREAARGDLWQAEPVGPWLELQLPVGTRLRIVDSNGARGLGILPQVVPGFVSVATRLFAQGPFDMRGASRLDIEINGNPFQLEFHGGDFEDRAHATAAELATAINNQPSGTLSAGPAFGQRPHSVEIQTIERGSAGRPVTIQLGGTALARFNRSAGTYNSPVDAPAVIRLPVYDRSQQPANFVDCSPVPAVPPAGPTPRTLTISIDGGATRTMTFASPTFADPSSLRCGELVDALRALLADDEVQVRACMNDLGVNVGSTVGGPATAFTQVAPMPAIGTYESSTGGPHNLSGAGFQFTVTDGTNPAVVPCTAANFVNPVQVWPDELVAVLSNAVAANSVQARVVARTDRFPRGNGPTEIEFSPFTPGRAAVGGQAGTMHITDDRGTTWREIVESQFRLQDRRVEAIAFHPTEPQTIYVGLYGERKDLSGWANDPLFMGTGPLDPGFLFRSTDNGETWTHIGGPGVADSVGNLVSVNALAVDPATPNHLYVATNVGVFRSTDRGDHWSTFNEGLPAVWLRDMVLEPKTRMLKVSGWGRGLWQRHVGDRPSKDVQLYVRSNAIDQGFGGPVPRGNDPSTSVPTFATLQSPDIKITRTLPARFAAAGAFIDGVDFDSAIVNDPVVAGSVDVLVQVHNGGHEAAEDVNIVAYWADASLGTPDLPDDFWEELALQQLLGPLPPTMGVWNLVGEHTILDAPALPNSPPPGYHRVTNEMPRVHRFTTVLPPAVDSMTSLAVITVVSCPRDFPEYFSLTELNVDKALDLVRHFAVRRTPVVHTTDDGQLYLRSQGSLPFAVAAGPTDAAAPLGLAVAAAATTLQGGAEPFNLQSGGASPSLLLQHPAVLVTLTVNQRDVATPGGTTAADLAGVFNRQIIDARLPVAAVANGTALQILPTAASTVALQPSSLNAAPVFPGPVAATPLLAQNGPYNLNPFPAGGHTLSFNLTWQQAVTFDPAMFTNAAAATARDVRTVINAATRHVLMPVRAEVPQMQLAVAGSATDRGDHNSNIAGQHLAEIAVASAPVASNARPALFNALTAFTVDRLVPSAVNFLYLKVTNGGNIAGPIRRRLFLVDHTVRPLTLTAIPIPGPVPPPVPVPAPDVRPVPAGGEDIVEISWNPGALTSPGKHYVLAIVDRVGREIDETTSLASFDDFHAFAASRPDVAYREFEV